MEFGNYENWKWFNEQFECFTKKHPALEASRDRIFVGKFEAKHHSDYIIFGLGRVCVEDFEQILNLCGNGFGIGGMQMLRSMYERQVTAAFISKYPDEVDAFAAYDYVHTRRLVEQLKEVYKNDAEILDGIVSEAEREKIEENYEAAKKDFLKVTCKKCDTKDVMFSWHKYDVGTMALKGQQPELKDFFPFWYFRPLLMSHGTFKSVEARVVFKDDDSFSFESDGQREAIKEALVGAHHLLMLVFDLQNKHFHLGLDEELKEREKDYLECWATEVTEAPAAEKAVDPKG